MRDEMDEHIIVVVNDKKYKINFEFKFRHDNSNGTINECKL